MSNSFYNHSSGIPLSLSSGSSAEVRGEYDDIAAGFTLVETALAAKPSSASPTFSGQVSFALGSASSPSITFTGDTNTGMFSPGADTLAWSTAGAEGMRLDSTGHFAVGSTPTSNVLGYFKLANGSATTSEYAVYGELTATNSSGSGTKTGAYGRTNAHTGYAGSGTLVGVQGVVGATAAVTVPAAVGVNGQLNFSSAATITTAACFRADIFNAGGATMSALQGFLAPDFSFDNYIGFYGNVASGTGKYNIYAPGTASNYLAGTTTVGTSTVNSSGAKLQVSDGVTFPATQVPSSDVNTLDDYEEGTFTPTVFGSSTAGTATYFVQYGRYTKVGRLVTFDLYVQITNHTGTGDIRVGGLPFTVSNAGTGVASYLTVIAENVAVTAGNICVATAVNTGTHISLLQVPIGAGGGITAVPMDTSFAVFISGSYPASN